MDQGLDIADLLAAAARKDRDAFRAIYARTSSKLFGVALRICRDRSLAEDAVQDAYVEIWRKAGDFDAARGRAESWMGTIARNRAIDVIRRRGRGPVMGAGGTEDEADRVAAIPDPGQPSDGGAEGMALTECLGRLEERQREMVLLAYHEGYSREELSARYDAPVNTIKTWLRRGLASLKTCLEE